MRTLPVLAAAAILASLAAAWIRPRPARAQATPTTLYVSGLHLAARNPTALVTLTNTSKDSADFYAISYQAYHADGLHAADPVNVAAPLLAGRSMTIDVAGGINGFRAGLDIGPYAGPVLLVIRGASCEDSGTCPAGATPRPFGPDVIHVETVQTEGAATYEAAVQWYVSE